MFPVAAFRPVRDAGGERRYNGNNENDAERGPVMVAIAQPASAVVKATPMEDHDQADWTIVASAFKAQNADLADRVLNELHRLRRYTFGYQVDRYTHCLQTATRALRAGA